jgi:5-formyltetrahydrofolate cyclo-ligase
MEPGFAEAAATLVVALPAFARAGAVALYAAMPDEVSTCPMQRAAREAGKRRLLPRICEDRRLEFAECGRWEDLRPGRYRVLEPPADAAVLALCDVDLVVVPGLAFDRRGGRLGRGGGYYDRALAEARGRSGGGGPFVVGLTSSNQLVEEVPREAFDQLVDVVVTERELIAREPTRT